ncbi:MAG: hypothetical protein ACI4E1_02425 [Lachnospira sp.]
MCIYKRKRILAILLCFMIAILSGCQRKSVADAQEIAEKEIGKVALNLTLYHEQRAEETRKDKNNVNTEEPSLEVDKESSDKVVVANTGEEINVADLIINVTDMIISDNINDVSKIADEASAQIIITDLLTNFGPDSRIAKINGDGWINADGTPSAQIKDLFFVKITVRNDSKVSNTVCVNPVFYSQNIDGNYQYKAKISMGSISKDQNCTFEAGQQEEFVMAFMSKEELSGMPLYMSTSFLSKQSFIDPTKIEDGCVFIKLTEE